MKNKNSTEPVNHAVPTGEVARDMYVNAMPFRYILGTRIDATTYADATHAIMQWARARLSRYVCAANVHMVMEAYDDLHFRRVVNSADLVTSDGMPLVWALHRMGIEDAMRVYGPDLMLSVCEAAQREQLPVALYGGSADHLTDLTNELLRRFPSLQIVFTHAPPFRPLTKDEDEDVIRRINASGARIVFVGLGCPKQETWMLEHKGRIQSVMLGVGAAFDFYSGRVRQAPRWMMRMGLEWLYRLTQDPKRLWRRYIRHNPRFMVFLLLQFLGFRSVAQGKVPRF